ncbi:hypothetical protein J3R30DRAFT_3694996 [Lentinula aciculospora]|uniref:Zn(2)-C6 fungal-type domain-containing protein n=1 Tax=Lentinula aciculospora TaxID=153920 RepID=A0A9W9DZ15_9AGAR|nr:hypothetical protein J3R30DRAFT_3694996 [Lentinula aciculospora]
MSSDALAQISLSSNSGTRSVKKNGSSGQVLRKGRACIKCRHLKIKCDGVKPVCGPCSESSRDADCSYADPLSRSTRLQRDIEELLARIEVLETSNGSSRENISAQNPSARSPSLSLSLSPNSPEFSHSSCVDLVSCHVDYSSSDSEPPVPERSNLIDAFLGRCTTLAFFLDPDTFRRSALLSLPLGDPQRPSPALLACVYLYGLRISSSPRKVVEEPAFLRRARRFIALEIGTQDRSHILHVIQAKILLTIYLVNIGQFLEAEFHSNGAVSLVLSCGMHLITPTANGVYDDPEGRLPPCTGPAEQAERINAFWSVVFIQRMLAVLVDSPSNSFGSLDSSLEIRTPFPINTVNYTQEDIARTLYDFLTNTLPQPPDTIALAIFSKSAILFHRAIYLHKKLSTGDRSKITGECVRLEQIVLNFHRSLPDISYIKELEATSSSPPFISSEKLSLMHAKVLCACVHIQSIFSSYGVTEARKRLIDAAVHLFTSLESSYPGSHPIAGTISRLACEAIIQELDRVKSSPVWTDDTSDMARKMEEESQLETAITDGMGTMSILVTCCPLVGGYFLGFFTDKFEAHLHL